MAQKFHLCCF